MAITYTDNGGGAPNGSDKEFTYTFPVIQTEDVKVALNGVTQATTKYAVDNVSNPTKITFNNTSVDSSVQESTGAPKSGVRVRVYRETTVGKSTGDDDPKAVFAAGSSIRAVDLNANVEQALYAIHELQDRPIETEDLQDESVTSAKIANGTIVNEDINASADIENSKIADGLLKSGITINSANIVNGSILDEDISSGANIQGTKLQNDSVPLTKLGGGALPTDITVSRDNIVNGTIQSADIETGTLDNRYYTETELDGGQLDNRYFTETELNNGQLNNIYFTETELTGGSLDGRYFTETELTSGGVLDGRYYTETQLDAGQLDNRYYTESELNGGQLDTRYFTESEITGGAADSRYYTETELDAGQLDNRYFTETELTSGGALDGRYFTETEADARFLRQDSTDVIDSNATWSVGNTHVATTGAIEARIIDLIDDVGGFTAIANETSFPATNPQGSTGQAAILSIAAVSTTLTPSNNVITIANGAGTGNTVTINGVTPSSIPTGFGLLVQSTSTTHTYNFHRLVPKALDVNTVSSNITNIVAAGANVADINNFADLYIISNNQPTQRNDGTNLQEGDLWYDSSNDNLQVYTGSAFSIITPSQSVLDDVAIVSGAITYSEDLGLITDAVSTGSSNGSLDIVADALEDEITFAVTVVNSGGNKYVIDGDTSNPAKTLTLHKGWTYTFDQSDSSNSSHPLVFKTDSGAYTTNVTVTGTAGTAGAKVQIVVPESQPTGNFRYYCGIHGNSMGNTITVVEDPIKAVSDIASSVVTVGGISTNVATVANNISNVNAAVSNQSNINAAVSNASNINAAVSNASNINSAVSNASNINTVATNISNVNSVGSNISNVNSVNSNASNINSAVSNATNINTVAGSIADVNRYANEYQISNTQPSSPSAGDLWFDGNTNTLKNYNGSAWLGITSNSGIQSVFDDSTPELAAALDCNNFNLTDVGTINGTNLQLDFGTL